MLPVPPAIAFSCATLTASVSFVPAATPVICLVAVLPLPTDTAACVAFHAADVFAEANLVDGSYPAISLSTEATESAPSATPPSFSALASEPSMTALLAVVVIPPAEEPITIVSFALETVRFVPMTVTPLTLVPVFL